MIDIMYHYDNMYLLKARGVNGEPFASHDFVKHLFDVNHTR